jgi:hypothetical protein
MAYQKKQGLKYIGKSQKKIFLAITEKPMTIHGLMHKTRLKNETVVSALKGLLFKGYVAKKEHFFVLTEDNNDTKNSNSVAGFVAGPANPSYTFDLAERSVDL